MSDELGRSLGAVIRDIGGNVDRIVRAELQVALAEMRQALDFAKEMSALVVAGAVCATLTLGFFLLGVMFALSIVMPLWGAAMLVALVCGIAAALIISAIRRSPYPVLERPSE
jgi:uncharacterized membrane protein YqjE